MRTQLLSTVLVLGFFAPSAFAATETMTATPRTIERILNAVAKPGDEARSLSNPNISYRVLANGTVVMVNAQTGTQKVFKPRPVQVVNTRGGRW